MVKEKTDYEGRRSKLDRKCWEEEKGRGKGVPIREKRGKVGSEKEKENEHGKGRGKILKGILIILIISSLEKKKNHSAPLSISLAPSNMARANNLNN